jgi:adenosylcobinamide kinase/adenosylcobinamide-phosphate guanylyltransferase
VPASWRSLEAPRHIGEEIQSHIGEAPVVLVVFITLLVSYILLALGDNPDITKAEQAVQDEIQGILQTCQSSPVTCIAVSNEVGLGVVPEHRLGRLYRDLLGKANQALAAQADEVYLMVAGLAIELKALAAPRTKR